MAVMCQQRLCASQDMGKGGEGCTVARERREKKTRGDGLWRGERGKREERESVEKGVGKENMMWALLESQSNNHCGKHAL